MPDKEPITPAEALKNLQKMVQERRDHLQVLLKDNTLTSGEKAKLTKALIFWQEMNLEIRQLVEGAEFKYRKPIDNKDHQFESITRNFGQDGDDDDVDDQERAHIAALAAQMRDQLVHEIADEVMPQKDEKKYEQEVVEAKELYQKIGGEGKNFAARVVQRVEYQAKGTKGIVQGEKLKPDTLAEATKAKSPKERLAELNKPSPTAKPVKTRTPNVKFQLPTNTSMDPAAAALKEQWDTLIEMTHDIKIANSKNMSGDYGKDSRKMGVLEHNVTHNKTRGPLSLADLQQVAEFVDKYRDDLSDDAKREFDKINKDIKAKAASSPSPTPVVKATGSAPPAKPTAATTTQWNALNAMVNEIEKQGGSRTFYTVHLREVKELRAKVNAKGGAVTPEELQTVINFVEANKNKLTNKARDEFNDIKKNVSAGSKSSPAATPATKTAATGSAPPAKPTSISATAASAATSIGTDGGTVRIKKEELFKDKLYNPDGTVCAPKTKAALDKVELKASIDDDGHCTGVSVTFKASPVAPEDKYRIAQMSVLAYVRLNGVTDFSGIGHEIPISGKDKTLVALTYLFCKTEGITCSLGTLPDGEDKASIEKHLFDMFQAALADPNGKADPAFGKLIAYYEAQGKRGDLNNVKSFGELVQFHRDLHDSAKNGTAPEENKAFFEQEIFSNPTFADPSGYRVQSMENYQKDSQFAPDRCTKPDKTADVKKGIIGATANANPSTATPKHKTI